MRLILRISFIFFFTGHLFSQTETPFDKVHFKDQKEQLKEALKSIKFGDDALNRFPYPDYKTALSSFEEAARLNPNNSELNYKMGICLLHTNFRTRSLPYFQKAYLLNPVVTPEIKYYLGMSNQLGSNWEEAIKNYQNYIEEGKSNKSVNQDLMQQAYKRIEECNSGIKLQSKPIRVFIDNLGKNINTEYPEYGMIMNADGSEIYFTSRRNTTTGGLIEPNDGMYNEDIFYAQRNGNDGWTLASNIGEPINTKGHDATVALSPDGQKMLVYIDDKGDGNIYESKRTGASWSKPKKLDKIICSPYHESSAWYSPDGKRLFFISDRPKPGSKKDDPTDNDIYYVTWDNESQNWTNLVRLPDNVNSKYDEDGVFVHPDGKTIYFSSKGHNSMGGYDIFYSTMDENGNFSNPINIGSPINTPDDDVFFTMTASGRFGFMTSFRTNGFGEKDLYKITFLGEPKEPLLNTDETLLAGLGYVSKEKSVEPIVINKRGGLALLKGTIFDDKTKIPLYAKIELYDNEHGILLTEFESDSKTGRYMLSLPAGKNYGIAVKANGYLFHSENFDVPKGSNYSEYNKDVYMKKIEVGQTIVLKNIFYDFDKATLRPESKLELDRLIKLMNDNPTLKIEIGSHTDSRGAEAYNLALSEDRAKSVVDYLINAKINANRLNYKGYGESQLINSDSKIGQMKTKDEKEAAHQENRRTEFKILAK